MKNKMAVLFFAAALFQASASLADQNYQYAGMSFEVTTGWWVTPEKTAIYLTPPEGTVPDGTTVRVKIAKMAADAPKDLAGAWNYAADELRSEGVEFTVTGEKSGTLAGKPAKIVMYTTPPSGITEGTWIYKTFVSNGNEIIEITYTSPQSLYEKFWPGVNHMLESLKLGAGK